MEQLKKFLYFLSTHRRELLEQCLEHLWLTLISLFIAVVLGVVAGIIITRFKKLASPVLVVVNAVQTIPSIALLGFLLPFLGIGPLPAIVALFVYALLPIVRNTYAGLSGIDPAVREAALGMGMSNMQLIRKIEIPLAMPIIFAGIRTAFVINVGVATLCALIAAGGLGEFIFRGLSTNNTYMILAGAIPAALMALTFDFLMARLQSRIGQSTRLIPVLAILFLAGLVTFLYTKDHHHDRWVAGFPSEFIGRQDGYIGLRNTYALDLEVKEMEIGLMYQAVKNEDVDVISGFSTDGRIKSFDLKMLKDDKNYFPPYYAAPIVRTQTLQAYPEINNVLHSLKNMISNEEMTAMNYYVDEEGQDIEQVARDFLNTKGWVLAPTRQSAPDIIIGSKNFTESFILANLFKLAIESKTNLSVGLKLGFGGTKLLFDALNTGAVDIYPEYTGTGLLVILQAHHFTSYHQDSVYQYVQKEFSNKYTIQWMSPLGFNNTFALMMKRQTAEQFNIENISDLSGHRPGN